MVSVKLMWMAGGGAKAGYIHGESDKLGFSIARGKLHVHDLQATILHLLGFAGELRSNLRRVASERKTFGLPALLHPAVPFVS